MASKDVKYQELTEAEKRELTVKVYPSLKSNRKKNPIMRLLRFPSSIFLLLLLISCSAEKPIVQTEVVKPAVNALIIKNGMTKAEDPKEFELSMPESDLSLASVYKYSKEPTVTKISDNVIDFDYENGMFVLLKEDRLETNVPSCLSVNLRDRYTSVLLSGGLVLINSPEKAELIDIAKCGITRVISSKNKGLSLSGAGFLEFNKTSYTVFDRYKNEEKTSGTFIGGVIFGQILIDKLLFATENGKIALIDGRNNKFVAINEGNINYKAISISGEDINVLTTENKLVWLIPDMPNATIKVVGEAQGKDGCFLLKKSGYMYCDGYITSIDKAFKSPIDADSGLYTQGLLFLKKDDVLYFADSELVYKKSVVFGKSGNIQLCLKDGKTFFNDFDGSVKYFTAEGMEFNAEKYPDECDHSFAMTGGALKTPTGKTIYKFADVVSQSSKAIMLKRIIGQEIYYYFEPR